MTQEEFAQEVGVTVSTVNRWESVDTEPNSLASKVITRLAKRWGLIDLQIGRPPLPFH